MSAVLTRITQAKGCKAHKTLSGTCENIINDGVAGCLSRAQTGSRFVFWETSGF